MKTRRSDRLIDMTRYLLESPHTLISLTFFAERYESAKSSISEDLAIIKRTFKLRGIGILETIPGAAGGAGGGHGGIGPQVVRALFLQWKNMKLVNLLKR